MKQRGFKFKNSKLLENGLYSNKLIHSLMNHLLPFFQVLSFYDIEEFFFSLFPKQTIWYGKQKFLK